MTDHRFDSLTKAVSAPRSRRAAVAAGLTALLGVGVARGGRFGAAQGDASPVASPGASPVASPGATPIAVSDEVLALLETRVTPGIPPELQRTPAFDQCCARQDDSCIFSWIHCLVQTGG